MTKAEQTQGWFSGWLAARRAPQADPADMGTAFGLDLSLSLLHPETAPVPAAPSSSWLSRLTLRRKNTL